MPVFTQSLLHRKAQRALKTHAQLAGSSPAIDAFSVTLVPSATAFIKAYEAAQSALAARTTAVVERRSAKESLGEAIRLWLPLLRRDLKSSLRKGLGSATNVAEDMMTDARAILDLLERHAASDEPPLSYHDALRADLEPLIAEVDEELNSSGGTQIEVAAVQAQARILAEAFYQDLVAFRATIRAKFGRAHPSYQALRTRTRSGRAEGEELEEDELSLVEDGEPMKVSVTVVDDEEIPKGQPEVVAS